MTDLSNCTALVTGSFERTGLGIAEELARHGAQVILHGRTDDERRVKAQQLFRRQFDQIPEVVFGDINSPEACSKLAQETDSLDILVNNAGILSTTDQIRARAEFPAYQIAKTGVHLLTLSYAQRFAHKGLTANTVSPGQLANSIDLETAGELPSGRPGEVKEVAAAVAFLASEKAAYISGANLNVAGGWEPTNHRFED